MQGKFVQILFSNMRLLQKSVFLGHFANDYPLKRTLIILTYIVIT
jgi:hypothetical protein